MRKNRIEALVKAARRAPTLREKDELLALVEDALAERRAETEPVDFPVRIYLTDRAKMGHQEGLLFEDGSVEVNGRRFDNPSRPLLDLWQYRTNGWVFWRYNLPDGKSRTIEHLRPLIQQQQ